MTFTSHITPIGEIGNSPTLQTEIDPIYVSGAGDVPAGSIGSEGSSDDPQANFPDTFVDMAKDSSEALLVDEKSQKKTRRFFKRKKKNEEESSDSEASDQPSEEIL